MIKLIQLQNGGIRKVGLVDEPRIKLLGQFASVYELAYVAITSKISLTALARQHVADESLDYDAVYAGRSEWRILPAVDHPEVPARCLVTGTGLTHMASAKNRNAMHTKTDDLTDSMKMFRWGIEGGRPEAGQIGVAPEWFYKGCGTVLRAHGEPLVVPLYAFSFGAGIQLADGDVMKVRFEDFGRALCNPVKIDTAADAQVTVLPLYVAER